LKIVFTLEIDLKRFRRIIFKVFFFGGHQCFENVEDVEKKNWPDSIHFVKKYRVISFYLLRVE